jgi:hypothetical protein
MRKVGSLIGTPRMIIGFGAITSQNQGVSGMGEGFAVGSIPILVFSNEVEVAHGFLGVQCRFARQGDSEGKIPQLPDVARPRLLFQEGQVSALDDLPEIITGFPAEKMAEERSDILATVPEGRDLHRKDIQTIEEIGEESPLLDRMGEVLIGCRDNLSVQPPGLSSPHRAVLSFLDQMEESGLEIGREDADLIQEEGSFLRRVEETGTGRNRPRKGSPDVSEQFAFNQSGWKGRTIDRRERLGAATREPVNGPCGQTFAGSPLTVEEHHDLGVGHHL